MFLRLMLRDDRWQRLPEVAIKFRSIEPLYWADCLYTVR